MFSKIFQSQKYGQILVKKDRNGEDKAEVRFYVKPENLGVCSVAIAFDHDQGANAAFKNIDISISEMFIEKFEYIFNVCGKKAAVKDSDNGVASVNPLNDVLGQQIGGEMKVSIDGARRSATAQMNTLGRKIESLRKELPDHLAEELAEEFNKAAQYVDIFNCIYSDKIEMFNDLSNEIQVKTLNENCDDDD